jgi:hypothetical protein
LECAPLSVGVSFRLFSLSKSSSANGRVRSDGWKQATASGFSDHAVFLPRDVYTEV